jgi:aspartate kinase
MGATVLHDEAIFPVRNVGIPINIRNTREPENPGTMIVPARVAREPVRGLAARSGFTMFNIEKTLMNKEVGFALKLLRIFYDLGVSFEHMPTGIDTISIIVKDELLDDSADTILRTIERDCEPDRVTIAPGLALIATVGQGMSHHIGVAARLCQALSDANINIRVIDQGSSETNIIIGVNEDDMDRAVQAIYSAFEAWK